MTRYITRRFRRLVLIGAIVPGAAALAIGMSAAAASAAPTWGQPNPTPTVHYTPPPKPVCFFSLETEHDALPAQLDNQGGDQGGGYGQPSSAPVWGQPNGNQGQGDESEAVEVVQLVKVCVTEKHQQDSYGDSSWNKNGDGDVVTVTDASRPFAWIVSAGGMAPTPTGLPSSIAGMLTQ